jgi:rhamnose utilization protein RhaD (predicted bifunctional aldolase and dehydrogenase)
VSEANNSGIEALIDVSARLGRDPLLVQAGSGNTSVKIDGILWIKASGKWLAHAAREEIFVPVDLVDIKSCIQRKKDFVAQYTSRSGLRLVPSIETAMHALVPWPVTIHIHSVNTIAWAVREDGPAHLADRLAGLRWQWIPYVGSGLPLAREVEKTFSKSPETEILVLGNHGLVVCGKDARAAEELLFQVEKRLATEPRPMPEPDRALLQRIAHGSEWCLPDLEAVHALSTDAISRAILVDGILYPCQAIFLGPSTPLLASSLPVSEAIERHECCNGARPRFFVVEGNGVIVSESMTRAEREMLLGLAEVVRRIDVKATIRYLSQAELTSVLNAEAYRYRGLVENSEDTPFAVEWHSPASGTIASARPVSLAAERFERHLVKPTDRFDS